MPAAFAGLLLLLSILPSSAGAMARDRAPVEALASSAQAEAAKVARYWTPARMRATPPLDGPLAGQSLEPFASASFTPVPDATLPPLTVNGRIFVKQGDGRGYCSGTAINSPTRQLVLTAGHCVNSGPEGRRGRSVWSRYMQFVPAYTDGLAPFGSFVARRSHIYAPHDWTKWGNPDYDMGAFLAFPNANGENVADAVGGGATIFLDKTRKQRFQTYGYPGSVQMLQKCNSPYVGDDRLTYPFPGPPTLAIRCRWTPGASGGGWFIENGLVINGLTSYGHQEERSNTYGPYFSSETVGRMVNGL